MLLSSSLSNCEVYQIEQARSDLERSPAVLASQPKPACVRHRRAMSRMHQSVLRCLEDTSRPFTQKGVARDVGLSPATIRRYLRHYGSNYRQVKRNARQLVAMRYLRDGVLSLSEIAALTGYSEPSAFFRAFKQWTHLTPRQFQQLHVKTIHTVEFGTNRPSSTQECI